MPENIIEHIKCPHYIHDSHLGRNMLNTLHTFGVHINMACLSKELQPQIFSGSRYFQLIKFIKISAVVNAFHDSGSLHVFFLKPVDPARSVCITAGLEFGLFYEFGYLLAEISLVKGLA